jgi:hypothetical protein
MTEEEYWAGESKKTSKVGKPTITETNNFGKQRGYDSAPRNFEYKMVCGACGKDIEEGVKWFLYRQYLDSVEGLWCAEHVACHIDDIGGGEPNG